MASKGRRAVRATIKSAVTGAILYHMSMREADQKSKAGVLAYDGEANFTEVEGKSETPNSPTNLTWGDMEGVVEQRPHAMRRFKSWPHIHDTRAVTVTAHGTWTPDPQVSAIRAKMREQEHQLRRQQECTELRKQMLNAKSYADAHRN
jgi:hypothetical protein